MSASNVSGFMNIQIPSGNFQMEPIGRSADQDGDATGRIERAHSRQGGGGQLVNAVAQSLSQLGLGQPGLIAVTAPAATPNASGDNTPDSAPSSSGQNIEQTLQTFMHALFQALTPNGAPGARGLPRPENPVGDHPATGYGSQGASGYANLASQLQGFVQNLGSQNNTAATAVSDLEAAFQNLTKAMGANTNAAASRNSTSLQTFLEDLSQNLQNAGNLPLSGLGNAVKTFA